MSFKIIILSIISLSSLMLAFLLAAALTRARSGGKTKSFAGLTASSLLYSVGYLLELTSPDLQTTLAVIRVEYIGIALIAPFLLLVARDFADNRIFRIYPPLLFVVPAIIIGFVFTINLHDLYYINPYIVKTAGLTIIHFGRGPLYWLQVFYLTLAIAVGVFIFAQYSISGPRPKRMQASFMLIGCVLPWIGNLL